MIYSSNGSKGANSTFEEWKLYIDAALEVGGWATFCLHNVCNTGKYYNLDEEYAHQLFSYTNKENIWVANYTDALMYYSEWSTATTFAEFIDGKIYVTLSDGEDDALFTEALTVKVTVPESWKTVTLDGKTLTVNTDESGESFVYVDIVPDSGTVILSGN
jgi:hypothetical protein